MNESSPNKARYFEIRVEGHLDEARASQFAGMYVTLLPNGHTLISGAVLDQAALFGLLIRIRDMGIPLVSVMRGDQ